VSLPLSHPRSGTALHGLLLLALAAIMMDCLFSGQEAIDDMGFEPQEITTRCAYQVQQDGRCLGTIFVSHPEAMPKILEAVGLSDKSECAEESAPIPCDRIIQFRQGLPSYSLERIRGAHLVLAGRAIDINLADEGDLVAIPGIGPRTAERIVHYRETLGRFSKVEDLQKVPGIGKKKFATMAPFVEVRYSDSLNKLQYVQAP
jgi:competence ComEA-like helix-hairpin-helix protein